MTREEIKNTPELVGFMLDKCVLADSRTKVRKRLEEVCDLAIKAINQEFMLEKIFNIVRPLSIMSTDKLEHEAIMQITEMLEPLYLLESEDNE